MSRSILALHLFPNRIYLIFIFVQVAFCFSDGVPFDLVFLIRLKYVEKGPSLVEIIKTQHDGLKSLSNEYIQSILEGETNKKVLLMLDGYDEYKPGTNKDIDEAIESTIGNCFLILTSRPGDYLGKSIRDKMDGEIIIEGLSEKNIKVCSTKYLKSEELSEQMFKQAEETGIYSLLHIPIILVMTVVVFIQEESLPKTKTGIYETIFRLTMDRTTLKTFGCKSANISKISELLYALGELSWNALQNDVQQLLLKQVIEFFKLQRIFIQLDELNRITQALTLFGYCLTSQKTF